MAMSHASDCSKMLAVHVRVGWDGEAVLPSSCMLGITASQGRTGSLPAG